MTGGKNHYEELIQSKLRKHITKQEAFDFQKEIDRMPTSTNTKIIFFDVKTGNDINFMTHNG